MKEVKIGLVGAGSINAFACLREVKGQGRKA